mmetsp:Transcript_17145/g.39148  ORF Transcript_17145/g.39148 Transcript_17145/m.39148 type:complete len:261 (+) Transcript_17145:125-907(+)
MPFLQDVSTDSCCRHGRFCVSVGACFCGGVDFQKKIDSSFNNNYNKIKVQREERWQSAVPIAVCFGGSRRESFVQHIGIGLRSRNGEKQQREILRQGSNERNRVQRRRRRIRLRRLRRPGQPPGPGREASEGSRISPVRPTGIEGCETPKRNRQDRRVDRGPFDPGQGRRRNRAPENCGPSVRGPDQRPLLGRAGPENLSAVVRHTGAGIPVELQPAHGTPGRRDGETRLHGAHGEPQQAVEPQGRAGPAQEALCEGLEH